MIYWLLLAFTVVFYGVCRISVKKYHPYGFRTIEEHNSAYLFYFITISAAMILVIGLRDEHVGSDTMGYYSTYKKMANVDYSYILSSNVNDKGYCFLQIFFNKIGWNFYAFNMLYAIFNISVISYLIYKKSSLPLLSYILYITFGFFVLDLTMIRQTTAMSIVILAVLHDKNRNIMDFLKFELMVIVAYFIHASAIIFLPMWFLAKMKFNKKTIVILLGVAILSYILKPFVSELVGVVAGTISDKYMRENIVVGNLGMRLYLMIAASVALGLYLHNFLNDRWNQLMFCYMCMILIIFPAVQGGGSLMRTYYYFYIFMIIYVPNLISGVEHNSDKITYYLAISLYVAVGLMLLSDDVFGNLYKIMPYKFFWQ